MKSTTPAELEQLFSQQKKGFESERYPTKRVRLKRLKQLTKLLKENHELIEEALAADFGCRSAVETRLAEVAVSLEGLRYARRELRLWMAPEERAVSIWFFPSKNQVQFQPKGVVGIIAPWNYPLYLTLGPLTAALAAGNRAMIKLPEQTPRFSELFAKLLAHFFPEDEVACVLGGPEEGAAFSALPFDHLLFTGSTQVGRLVMSAAAKNLTPVTLELGGKSPVLLSPHADLRRAAKRILSAKLLNGGQTCVAPDYVLVPKAQQEDFLEVLREQAGVMLPQVEDSPQYTSMINQGHFERLKALYTQAMDEGTTEFRLVRGPVFFEDLRKIAPVVLIDPPEDALVMKEEIFGPLLPVVGYENLSDALAYINARPRPLALYLFTERKSEVLKLTRATHSGSVAVNQCLMQVAQEDLPFGGIGASGMGRYHGREGFLTFSNQKGVYRQSSLDLLGPVYPPYTQWTERLLRWMMR